MGRVPLTVCFISHSAEKYGAEMCLLDYLNALSQRGIRCCFILPKAGPLLDDLRALNALHAIIPYRTWSSAGRRPHERFTSVVWNLLCSFAVAWRLLLWKCDVVYTNTSTAVCGAIAARMIGRRHLWDIHEFGEEDHGLRYDIGSRAAIKIIDALSEKCVVHSRAVAAKFSLLIPKQKIVLMELAVVPTGTGLPPDETSKPRPRCVIVGSLSPAKRQEDAILAVARLAKEKKPVDLDLIGGMGQAAYADYLRRLSAESGAGPYVHFHGYSENVADWIQRADIALVCSRSEAFGRATVEAMRFGKPVIAARAGATPELVQHGHTGLLYDVGDVQALSRHVAELAANSKLAQRLGQTAMESVRSRFTPERLSSQLWALLQKQGGLEN